MEDYRRFQAAVASRSLVTAVLAAATLGISVRQSLPAVSLIAGTMIGLACLFHIAGSFNRLVKGGKRYLPFLTFESMLRVLLAGAAPFLIVGRSSALGWFTYLAGFVVPLAVAILVYRQLIVDARDNAAAHG
ncbi:MAG TPA: hypothetical protein VEJ20_03010 [Candidatus Eremiobacteraceae bacterium]|nr:hypothetical protein [Candidatus Eremiobacteraceae bacterium]